MTHARVVSPGMLTTVQDLGRWGFQARGVSVAGPMDFYAHRLANLLAGNSSDAATLEVTLIGPEIEFEEPTVAAVAGATFDLTVGAAPVPMHAAFIVPGQSRLKFGARLSGARAYLAVAGGIAVAPVLGSRATHVTSGIGGVGGRAVRAGDRLPLGPPGIPRSHLPRVDALSFGVTGNDRLARADGPRTPARLRLLPGPQLADFPSEALRILQAAPYTVDQQSNRMAYRLVGEPVTHRGDAQMISDATPMGTLQVLPSGLPVLLMADRQTTGGYPHIATVMTADLPIAGQLAPGDALSFTLSSPADALAALIAQERVLMNVAARWAQ